MKNRNISINWKLEIDHAFLAYFKRGLIMLDDGNMLLAYNQETEDFLHAEKSLLVKIKEGEISKIFETRPAVSNVVVDENNDIYLAVEGSLLKISPDGAVIWKYRLEGDPSSRPVTYQDSIFIFDWIDTFRQYMDRDKPPASKKDGVYLKRLNKDGKLLWRKPFYNDANWGDPFILENKQQVVIGLNLSGLLMVLDMDGNIVREEKLGSTFLSNRFIRSNEGSIYTCINSSLIAFDGDMNIIWTYKPAKGRVADALAVDSEGNLHTFLTYNRLVSLDSHGKERWVTPVEYDPVYVPFIFKNSNVLAVTYRCPNGKKRGDFQSSGYLEIFSDKGKKLSSLEFPGGISQMLAGDGDTVYLLTSGHRIIGEEDEKNTIAVYSLRIS